MMDSTTTNAFLHLANLQFTPRLLWSLLAHFENDPCRALNATDSEREALQGWLPRHTTRLHDSAYQVTTAQKEEMERSAIRILLHTGPDYPPLLKEIHDPPPFLFVHGTFTKRDHMAVGIVGSRRASPYGRAVAEQMARELALHGITILSGGAAGIDTAAHRGVLSAQGRTCAVLGCGVDICYPQENQALFAQIRKQGALLSEYPVKSQPEIWKFPARNRIISGMAQAILIVEAPKNSGALITARYAVEHGRHLMVTPGNIDRPMSVGSNELLREGATPILDSSDILHVLRIVPNSTTKPQQTRLSFDEGTVAKTPTKPEPNYSDLSPTAQKILKQLSDTPKHLDQVALEVAMDTGTLGMELTLLELSGVVTRLPGNTWIRLS
jgi:DNA processing protein